MRNRHLFFKGDEVFNIKIKQVIGKLQITEKINTKIIMGDYFRVVLQKISP
jgi:hypothetical protein